MILLFFYDHGWSRTVPFSHTKMAKKIGVWANKCNYVSMTFQSMIVSCSLLTPYLHWREEAPYWKRHCSSASYTCPGATVGYRKSRFRGSLSRHVPRPELSKKQTFNGIDFSTEVSSVSNKRKKYCDKILHERERKGILLMGISKRET